MIIRSGQSLANDHSEWPASCKWSTRGAGLLQMIIWRGRPLANDHPEGPASCKWSSGGTGLLQMIIRHPRHSSQPGSGFNLADLSGTICSCFWSNCSPIAQKVHHHQSIWKASLKSDIKWWTISKGKHLLIKSKVWQEIFTKTCIIFSGQDIYWPAYLWLHFGLLPQVFKANLSCFVVFILNSLLSYLLGDKS